MLRAEEDREPAVGDLTGKLEVLRSDRCQVDGQVLAHPANGHPQGLAGAVRKRQGPVLALVGDGLAPQRHIDDVDILAGASQRRAEPDPVPTFAHLGSRDAQAEPEAPAGHGVEGGCGHRRHRRGPGRDLHHGRAEVDPLGQRAHPRQDGHGVRAVGLGGPDDRVPDPIGLLREHDVVRTVAGAPISKIQPEFHSVRVSGGLSPWGGWGHQRGASL